MHTVVTPRYLPPKLEAPVRRLAIVVATALLILECPMPSSAQAPGITQHSTGELDARATVAAFGRRIGQVSVLAPKEQVAKGMDDIYAAHVAPELLSRWKNDPETAAGKRTSSPSPERIDVERVEARGADAFVVTGKVILLTAKERRDGGIFSSHPVTMTVTRRNGRWLITAYEEKFEN